MSAAGGADWRNAGQVPGRMLHWPEIDEDIEVQHLIDGRMPIKARKVIAAVAEPRPIYGKVGKLRK